jgi:hypothetical protein
MYSLSWIWANFGRVLAALDLKLLTFSHDARPRQSGSRLRRDPN